MIIEIKIEHTHLTGCGDKIDECSTVTINITNELFSVQSHLFNDTMKHLIILQTDSLIPLHVVAPNPQRSNWVNFLTRCEFYILKGMGRREAEVEPRRLRRHHLHQSAFRDHLAARHRPVREVSQACASSLPPTLGRRRRRRLMLSRLAPLTFQHRPAPLPLLSSLPPSLHLVRTAASRAPS